MKKNILIQIAIGFLSGVIATLIGSVLYLELFTSYSFFSDFQIILKSGNLGRITALGSILNLVLFTVFIRKRHDLKARGCVLAVIVLTILTLFIGR